MVAIRGVGTETARITMTDRSSSTALPAMEVDMKVARNILRNPVRSMAPLAMVGVTNKAEKTAPRATKGAESMGNAVIQTKTAAVMNSEDNTMSNKVATDMGEDTRWNSPSG